jgi:predicted acetyltransferase
VGDGIEIRPIGEDEFEAVLEVARAAFGEDYAPEDAAAWQPGFPFERSLGAYERGRLVATSGVLSLEVTLPGERALPMGGLTWISTLPTHRRRGLLNQLMTTQTADMVARGECLSGLGASEGVIYGRFDYGPATSVMSFAVERAHSAFAPALDSAVPGYLSILAPDEAATALPAIYEALRLRTPGTVGRSPGFWQAHLADPPIERAGASRMLHVVQQDAAGAPSGYVSYRVTEEFKGALAHNSVSVVELVAGDTGSYAALWRYLLDTDLCKTVSCPRGRVDEPLRWLLADPRRFTVDELYDFLWLRLLDVPRALAARHYAAAGRLILEVTDTFPAPRTMRYALQVESEEAPAECVPTSAAPDLALDAGTLASAYLGGVSFATLAAAQRVRELVPGAVGRADALFSTTTAPFCSTEF